MGCSQIGQIIAVYGSDYRMVEFHERDGLRYMNGFIVVQRMGTAGAGIAEFTTAGANVAANHECRCPFSPAFAHIGATPTAANGVQAVGVDYPFRFGVSFIGTDIDFQPFGLTYSVSHYRLFRKKLVSRV